MAENGAFHRTMTRRQLLAEASAAGVALSKPAWAQSMIDLPLPGGPGARQVTTSFPQKGPMILQRTRPPLQPNDRVVRAHDTGRTTSPAADNRSFASATVNSP